MILGLAVVAPLSARVASAQQPTVLEIETDGQTFRAPDTVRAGWTAIRLVNEDDAPHMAMLVRLEDGHTLREFLDVYGEAVRTNGPRPPWGRRQGGPGATGPHQTTTVTQLLEPGHYAWVCIMVGEPGGVPHAFSRHEVHAFVVAPPANGAAAPKAGTAPEADVSIRLVDYAFELDVPIAPGHHVFRIHNEGSQPHEASLIRLPPGMSPEAFQEDLDAWLEGRGSAPEVAEAPTVASVASLEPGAEAFFEAGLAPGAYALLCFVTAPDGRPHVMHGMVRYIRVE